MHPTRHPSPLYRLRLAFPLVLAAACVPAVAVDTARTRGGGGNDVDDSASRDDSASADDTGLTIESFTSQMTQLLCDGYARCYGLQLGSSTYGDYPNFMAACVPYMTTSFEAELGACPTFDAVAAQGCIDAFTNPSCPAYGDLIEANGLVCNSVCP